MGFPMAVVNHTSSESLEDEYAHLKSETNPRCFSIASDRIGFERNHQCLYSSCQFVTTSGSQIHNDSSSGKTGQW